MTIVLSKKKREKSWLPSLYLAALLVSSFNYSFRRVQPYVYTDNPFLIQHTSVAEQEEERNRWNMNNNKNEWMHGSSIPPNTPGAFIHIGKTGGSTVAQLLRNGCHSWVKKPCHEVTHETLISRLTTYYHVPDFKKGEILKKQNYTFYVVQLRDPFDRFCSIFSVYHFENAIKRERDDRYETPGRKPRYRQKQFSNCFTDLESFAQALGNDVSLDLSDVDPEKESIEDCSKLPKGIVEHLVKYSQHWFWNIEFVNRTLLDHNPSFSEALLLVIRQESLWEDWSSANQFLGQKIVTLPLNASRVHDYSHLNLTVSRDVSSNGRFNICESLRGEYGVYFSMLRRAANIGYPQILHAWRRARENCPSLFLNDVFEPGNSF